MALGITLQNPGSLSLVGIIQNLSIQAAPVRRAILRCTQNSIRSKRLTWP